MASAPEIYSIEFPSHLIDNDATLIVKKLQQKGFTTYLVGGCIRDILIGQTPKDFDIVSQAPPEIIKKHLPRAYLIGKRFRLVLVIKKNKKFEVSTFRKASSLKENIPLSPDNIFGTPRDDAFRRDFTINSLFYDPVKKQMIDYCGGVKDLKKGVIKMIGQPEVRVTEDPVRILRGIRLAHKTHFHLDNKIKKAVIKHKKLIPLSPVARLREEILKWMKLKDPSLPFLSAIDYEALEQISPQLNKVFTQDSMWISELKNKTLYDKYDPIELFARLFYAYLSSLKRVSETSPEQKHLFKEYQKKLQEIKNQIRSGHFLEKLSKNKKSNKKTLSPFDKLCKLFYPMMINEWGVFKEEQRLILKALILSKTLNDIEAVSMLNIQEQKKLIQRKSFPLAFKKALSDHTLCLKAKIFWSYLIYP